MSVRDLAVLLSSMEPRIVPGEFVFVSGEVPFAETFASVREAEGTSFVVTREFADALSLSYEFIAGWITLYVQSALDAVGLTAAFSTRLAQAGISCNVIAGKYHDHLLVPYDQVERAITELLQLTQEQ